MDGHNKGTLDVYDLSFGKIGEGAYGRVFKATHLPTGDIVAVKFIDITKFEKKDRKKFRKEYDIHASIRHPNVIQMLESFETTEFIVVVTELAEIDLYKFLREQKLKRTKLAEHHVQKLACDLLSALHYLHSNRIFHRDLKPQNILLNNHKDVNNMVAKLCDFGLAKCLNRDTFLMESIKGTPLYMAPEVLHSKPYDEKADLWSLGCILYETLFGDSPVRLSNPNAKIHENLPKLIQWLSNPTIIWPARIASDCESFLKSLIKGDPRARPSWSKIIQHPYVANRLLILDDNRSDCPLTQTLTSSQQIEKEKQRNAIIFNRCQKQIGQAMNKCRFGDAVVKKNEHSPKKHNVIDDNVSISSEDSINAIIQTDLDTDVEGPIKSKFFNKGVAGQKCIPIDQNMVIQRFTPNNPTCVNTKSNDAEIITNDIGNLRIGTMAANIHQEEKRQPDIQWAQPSTPVIRQYSTSRELEQKKLCQNLENISIRMRSNKDGNGSSEKSKELTQSQNSERTGPTVMDSLASDSNVDSVNIQLKNDEWLAYILMTLEEVYNGQLSSITDPNMASMTVEILRNLNANTKVVECIVQMLSIPFVMKLDSGTSAQLRSVYKKTRLVPNLMVASKIICNVKPPSLSNMSSSNLDAWHTQKANDSKFRDMHELSSEEMKTLRTIYELVCHLMHLSDFSFLEQFNDSMDVFAYDLLRHFYANAANLLATGTEGSRLLSVITAILCLVLRETPEKAWLVERIIFDPSVDIIALLNAGDSTLRIRLCRVLRISGRFSCSALHKAWNVDLRMSLEALMDDDDEKVRKAAVDAVDELQYLIFYKCDK